MPKQRCRKVQVSLTFDDNVIVRIKEKAKAQQISLNTYLEILMRRDVENIPNEETKQAIKEANEGDLEDIEDLDSWLQNL